MLLGGLGLLFALSRNTPAHTAAPPTSVLLHATVAIPTSTPLTSIIVHISGAVVQPGVYELPADARTADAVQAAGGLLATADQTRVNLAARLEDAQQIIIPVQPPPALAAPLGEAAPAEADALAPPPPPTLININTASMAELTSLPGIGETLATRIILHRQDYGDFQHPDELEYVAGIGPNLLEQIRPFIQTTSP
ncbi:MAG: ComEA family DNA-binding protein [Chloroflexaceae bacterium]|nr:ComEA family DNA-binding protein [Chloroflexaceae bacterium]